MKAISNAALLGLAAALIPSIAAQGYVSSITIDGKAYEGPKPTNGKSDGKFAIRSVNSAQGLKGASNPDIGCGPGSQPASEHAEASPGSKIEVQWVGADGGAWPSSVGPVMAYMAPCPTMECRFVQPADAKWFKIYESSIRDDKTWAQEDLVQSKPASLILPAGLAKGAYLLRHEVIGLEDAKNEGGAQFYESCAQLNVSYGGSQTPDDSDLVSFPGAYSDTDKGILIDASSLGPNDYPYPGPPLAAIARGVNTGPSASMPAPTAAKRDDIPSSSAIDPPARRADDHMMGVSASTKLDARAPAATTWIPLIPPRADNGVQRVDHVPAALPSLTGAEPPVARAAQTETTLPAMSSYWHSYSARADIPSSSAVDSPAKRADIPSSSAIDPPPRRAVAAADPPMCSTFSCATNAVQPRMVLRRERD